MKVMIIRPTVNEVRGNDVIRKCSISRQDGNLLINEVELWFMFPSSIEPPESNDCDSYLLAMLMDGMLEGRDIFIQGSVSRKLLSNLIEFQSAWHKWLPNNFHMVSLRADIIREDEALMPGAVCAFSGGLDSTFTAWRNSQNKNSFRSQQINFCSLVHGFDIPLSDVDAFDRVIKTAGITLSDINLELIPMRTNYREISKVYWEHAHGTALVAALSNFKRIAGVCLIGSTESYDGLLLPWIPWGSSPITDHLLTSGGFEVIHDGASHTRAEKINEISDWEMGVNNLRVCWEGDLKDRNCGKCEKCLQTMLNFLVCNKQIPKCFPETVNLEKELRKLVLPYHCLGDWTPILEQANKNNIKASWVGEVRRVIRRKPMTDIILPMTDFFLPKGSTRRNLIKHLITRLGWPIARESLKLEMGRASGDE